MKIRNLDDLVVFLKVVDEQSFSAAARQLNLAPATVSKQIARLEQALGIRLFDRNTRHLRITDEGREVALRVRAALLQLEDAAEVAQQKTDLLSGVLRITAPVPLGARYLAPLIAQFRRQHPQLNFDLRLSDQIVDLYSSDVDLAVRVGALADSRLVSRRLTYSCRILVASPGYLVQHGTPSHPDELLHHQCLLFTYPGLRQNNWLLQKGARSGEIAEVSVAGELRSDNGDALRAWSRAGLGISLRETWDVVDELRSGSLVQVLPEWTEPKKPVYALRIGGDRVPRRVSVFSDFLAAQWQKAPWEIA